MGPTDAASTAKPATSPLDTALERRVACIARITMSGIFRSRCRQSYRFFERGSIARGACLECGEPIADVLLNQRVLAGIGNVFKSEILFLAGIHPFTPAGALTDTDLDRIVGISREQLAANVMTRSQTLSSATGRRTTRSLNPHDRLWVYSRGGKPCRRCGAAIQSAKSGQDARASYWCPNCQPAPGRGT
jgi:endonuclease-8